MTNEIHVILHRGGWALSAHTTLRAAQDAAQDAAPGPLTWKQRKETRPDLADKLSGGEWLGW